MASSMTRQPPNAVTCLSSGVPCDGTTSEEHQAVGRPHPTRGSGLPRGSGSANRSPESVVRRPSSSHVAAALAMSK